MYPVTKTRQSRGSERCDTSVSRPRNNHSHMSNTMDETKADIMSLKKVVQSHKNKKWRHWLFSKDDSHASIPTSKSGGGTSSRGPPRRKRLSPSLLQVKWFEIAQHAYLVSNKKKTSLWAHSWVTSMKKHLKLKFWTKLRPYKNW